MNIKNTPELSIIIATKNRVPYCINAIETILAFEDTNFELIVQDNTDNLELKNYIENNINDNRLVYNYTAPPFSSIDNFNKAMALTKGEYVCMIGDDDGLNPEIFTIVSWAIKNSIDSITPSIYVSYLWPNALSEGSDGVMVLDQFSSKIKSVKPFAKLVPLLEHGIVNYQNFELPKLYHGIIKKTCFDTIYSKTGHYFGGLSPDIYSAVALSSVVFNHIMIDYPLTISGACQKSTTVDNLKGKHAGNLYSAPHFRDRGNYIWDNSVPEYYSVQTIWAESALKAIKEMKLNLNLNKFSLPHLVADSLMNNKNIYKLIIAESNKLIDGKMQLIRFYLLVLFISTGVVFKKITNKFKKNPKRTKIIYNDNVTNMKQATDILINVLHSQNSLKLLNLDNFSKK